MKQDWSRDDDYDPDGADWMDTTGVGVIYQTQVDRVRAGHWRWRHIGTRGPWTRGQAPDAKDNPKGVWLEVNKEDLDEERRACVALADLLSSVLTRKYEDGYRDLFCWERDALTWIIRFMDRRPDGYYGCAWTRAFIDLNREAILADDRLDWNLRAARLRKEARDA